MKLKRLVSLILVLTCFMSMKVNAAGTTANGTLGDNLTWALDSDGLLTISGKGEMKDIKSGMAPWGAYSDSIKAVKISDGVTSIGNWAFFCCTNMSRIGIPASVTRIGAWSLAGCVSLKSITIPDSVTNLGDGAFCVSSGLTSVKMPRRLSVIPGSAFYQCENLTEIVIPENVNAIQSSAFAGCKKLVKIIFSGDAPKISKDAFQNVTATAYYDPAKKDWDTNQMAQYGGKLTWKKQTAEKPANPFGDVKAGAYYEEPVLWAVSQNITKGMTATTFAPDDKCIRAQVVTFLWRAAGQPEPISNDNPFVDVKSTDYFYKAVLWAVEQGITNGMDATHFGSKKECTRGQVATFLWRTQGKPEAANKDHPFTDIKAGAYYYDAVLWAVESGVTKGMSVTSFAPDSTCTRGQIVTFLHRALK